MIPLLLDSVTVTTSLFDGECNSPLPLLAHRNTVTWYSPGEIRYVSLLLGLEVKSILYGRISRKFVMSRICVRQPLKFVIS